MNDVLIQPPFSYFSMLFYCEIKIKPRHEICLQGPCGQGKREGKCAGRGVTCGRAGLRRCHRTHGEACWCMGRGARPRPVCLVTGSNSGHQDGNFLSAGDGPAHIKPLCPVGSEPGLGPGTLCCKAAMLAYRYRSPPAAKYKGTGTQKNRVHAQLGQILDPKDTKRPKNTTATFEQPRAKIGYCARALHTPPPKGWTEHLGDPSCLTPEQHSHPHLRTEPAPAPQGASKQGNLLFALAPHRCSRGRS